MQKTKVINVFEAFAGIGAQHKAIKNIKNLGSKFKVVGTSEWDARAIIAYAEIHNEKKFLAKLNQVKTWSEHEINSYLLDRTFSLNSKNPGRVVSKNLNFKQNLVAANIVNKNFPDIRKVTGKEMENVDLLTYSFPCQGLSIANMGRDNGIKETADSTSNLIWQIRRILLDAESKKIKLPKYLIMENVKNLLSKKHMPDYKVWLGFLGSLGYTTNTVVLNSLDFGSLQKRERVFAISTLRENKHFSDEQFKKNFLRDFKKELSESERERYYKRIFNLSTPDEILESIPKNTPSRKRMACTSIDLLNRTWLSSKSPKWTFQTLTTKQDRIPNIGMVSLDRALWKRNKLKKRFITTREAYLIMGFESIDFSKVKAKYNEGIITKEALYRQAGNSIVVQVLEAVLHYIKEKDEGNLEWK